MARLVERIERQQQHWARTRGIAFIGNGSVLPLDDNLFEPLRPDARSEYEAGAGDELHGKMLALHSSSALVCNLFHYWRYRDVGAIARACGLEPGYTALTFERAYRKPRGVSGYRPHADVELSGTGVHPVAIESKFTEQYRESVYALKEVYGQTPGIWGDYTGCELLANRIVTDKEVFRCLDAPQLLKHMVGLKTEYGEQDFTLIYLWYRLHGEDVSEHESEIERFKSYVAPEVSFFTITHQEVFQELEANDSAHSDYLAYMRDRYFSPNTI